MVDFKYKIHIRIVYKIAECFCEFCFCSCVIFYYFICNLKHD